LEPIWNSGTAWADRPAEFIPRRVWFWSAIWLGLIVVELVTNAVKYGSPSLESPIMVDVSPDEKESRVVVSDSGVGLPPDFDLKTNKGLGMQVVLLLVNQLHARSRLIPPGPAVASS
jgi:two-component sensor histidine kinase